MTGVSVRSTLGERVRWLRSARGLDQVFVATLLGKGRGGSSTISRIENGAVLPDDSTLRSLATILGCSVDFLQSDASIPVATEPCLRAYADAKQRTSRQWVAELQLAAHYIQVGDLKMKRDRLPILEGDLNSDDAIEEVALETRRLAGFGDDEPVISTVRTVERLGCIVLPMSARLGRHLGLSLRVDGIPMIAIPSGGEDFPGDRQRFTVSHELGHLILHPNLCSPVTSEEADRREKQAHRFAGAFLVPADTLATAFYDDYQGRATLSTLAEMKSIWGVAIKALVVRLRNLNLVDDKHARSLYKQISARGWNKSEPVEVPNEQAVWLQQSLARHPLPVDKIDELVGLSALYRNQWLDWTSSEAEVVNINSFQSA